MHGGLPAVLKAVFASAKKQRNSASHNAVLLTKETVAYTMAVPDCPLKNLSTKSFQPNNSVDGGIHSLRYVNILLFD